MVGIFCKFVSPALGEFYLTYWRAIALPRVMEGYTEG